MKPATQAARSRSPAYRPWIELLRPRQWLKNGFVLAPLVFAFRLRSVPAWEAAGWATAAFCMISSAVYILNDLHDAGQDRRHPGKANRPLPSGRVSKLQAVVVLALCVIAAAAIALRFLPALCLELIGGYAALMTAYTFLLKRIAIADVLCIAGGFVLRVMTGSAAIRVPASHWILLCTFLFASFLACTKRKAEIAVLGGSAAQHRIALGGYTPAMVDQINAVMLAAAIVAYSLYTVAPETVARVGSDHLLYTVPFVIYGLLRYLQISTTHLEAAGEPSDVVSTDQPLLICVLLWLAGVCWVLY